jgi:hypothetical protein
MRKPELLLLFIHTTVGGGFFQLLEEIWALRDVGVVSWFELMQ